MPKLLCIAFFSIFLASIIVSGCISQALTNEKAEGFQNIAFSKSHFWFYDEQQSKFEAEFQNKSGQDLTLDYTSIRFSSANGGVCDMTSQDIDFGKKIAKDMNCVAGNCRGLKYLSYEEHTKEVVVQKIPLKNGEWFYLSGALKGSNCGKVTDPYKFGMSFNMQDAQGNTISENGMLTGNWGGPA